jgi:hypothetical protein
VLENVFDADCQVTGHMMQLKSFEREQREQRGQGLKETLTDKTPDQNFDGQRPFPHVRCLPKDSRRSKNTNSFRRSSNPRLSSHHLLARRSRSLGLATNRRSQ